MELDRSSGLRRPTLVLGWHVRMRGVGLLWVAIRLRVISRGKVLGKRVATATVSACLDKDFGDFEIHK